jgi:hypothetical protein
VLTVVVGEFVLAEGSEAASVPRSELGAIGIPSDSPLLHMAMSAVRPG